MIARVLIVTLVLGLATAQARPHGPKPARAPALPARAMSLLAAFDREVADLRAAFKQRERAQPKDPVWVARALRMMAEVNTRQALLVERSWSLPASDRLAFEPERLRRASQINRAHVLTLKALIALHGWFTISGFGPQADADASQLVRSTLDLAFQRKLLAALRPLAAQHETNPAHLAYLEDQVAVFGDRGPQRFGTMGHCAGPGQWVAAPIDDAPHVNQRRKSVGLEPLATAQAAMSTFCHEATPAPH